MADTIIDRLFIALGIKTKDVEKGMAKAEKIIASGLDHIKDALMPLATGFALAGMVTSFTEGANQIAKAAERLGMSVEDLQAWQGAAEAMGAEGAEVNEMITDMNEHLVDMVQFSSGPAVDILNKLGISAKDAGGNIRPAVNVLLDLAEASEKVGKQNMLAYGKMLGFDAGMIDLLLQGRKGLEDLLKAQKELAVFNKEDTEIAKQGRIAWQGFVKSLQAIQAVIMRSVMPVLVTLTNWLTKAVVWARNNQPFMIALVVGFALAISKMLIPALVKLAATGFAAIAPWLPLLGLVTIVALAVDDLWEYFQGGENALPPVLSGFIALSSAGLGLYKVFGGNLMPLLSGLIKLVFGLGGAIFKTLIPALASLAVSAVTAMAPFLPWIALFMGIAAAIYGVWKILSDGDVVLQTLKAKVMSFFDTVSNGWNKVKDFFGFDDEEKMPLVSQEDMVKAVMPQSKSQTNNITSTANVGNITINTQATDANGIARSISPALRNEFGGNNLVMAANTGVIAK